MRALPLVLLVTLVVGCGPAPEGRNAAEEAFSSWGGPGRGPGRFQKPRAIAVSGDRIYVVDMSGRIQRFGLDGRWQASWHLDEVGRGYPTGLGVRADGCLAVADTHNYRVLIYNQDGEVIQTFGHEGGGPGEFTYLTDVEFDAAGNLYVSEHGREDRIQKFDPEGRFLTAWGGNGEEPGRFHRPQALAVGEDATVYVADAANHRIQTFSPDGKLLAVWGEPGRRAGQLLYPYDLALTPEGELLVCEYGNNRVQAFDRQGRSLGVWGKPGRNPGELATPWAVSWVPGRGLYVVDTGNNRVQLFAEGLRRVSAGMNR